MQESIRLNYFKNTYDNLVKSQGEVHWELLCEFFSTHKSTLNKEDVPLFNLVRYVDEFDPHYPTQHIGLLADSEKHVSLRRKINLIQADALVLDYDGGITIDEAKHRFSDYEYLAYTSYNHLKDGETHKFRIVFPLVSPIPINARIRSLPLYEELASVLLEFAGPCDPVVTRPNQHYYIPATHPDRLEYARTWVNHGKILDWTEWVIPVTKEVMSNSAGYSQHKLKPNANNTLDPDTEFVTQEGVIKAKDVKKLYQKVQCPFHDDKKGSEFLKRFDDSGIVYFKCRHCGGFALKPHHTEDEISIDYNEDSNTACVGFEVCEMPFYYENPVVDRTKIKQELKKIKRNILEDQTQDRMTRYWSPVKSHILYLPEGSGKSQLAIEIVKDGMQVVFACQTWSQVYEKQREFQEALKSNIPKEHINVVVSHSFESRFKEKWKFSTVREGNSTGYKMNKINKDATIIQIMKAYPSISTKYIKLWWTIFSTDTDKISQSINKALEIQELLSVEYEEEFGEVLRESFKQTKCTGMVVTTFSQLRLLVTKGDFIPSNVLIWFDDPGLDDVADISPIEEIDYVINIEDKADAEELTNSVDDVKSSLKKSHGYSEDQVDETLKQIKLLQEGSIAVNSSKTKVIQGVYYDVRPAILSLGKSTIKHRMVFTTTELLTKRLLIDHLCKLMKPPVIHGMMEKVPYGRVTVIGTNKVRRRYDAIIPVIIRILDKKYKSNPVQLIADGLGSVYNHVNSKGVNCLTETDVLIEVSVPHPNEVKKVCAVLEVDYDIKRHEITIDMMLDKVHQAIGRNSGYRWKEKESVVLVDKKYHAEMIKSIRYNIDPENSVLIDKTQTMSSKEKRIQVSASPLTEHIEEHLNNVNQLISDKRSIKHTIDSVIKEIAEGDKRNLYIARLLTALTTFSKIELELESSEGGAENNNTKNYRYVWNHIMTKWVNELNQRKIMTDYQSCKKTD
jgi:hypothetical protein